MAEASERKRQTILRNEIAWMQRGARARSTKQKAHIQRYEELRDQKGPEYDRNVELESIASRLGQDHGGGEGFVQGLRGQGADEGFHYIS